VQLTQKKAALQFKALDQVLQSFNKDTNVKEALSYRCADLDRIVPTLMGVSKARRPASPLLRHALIPSSACDTHDPCTPPLRYARQSLHAGHGWWPPTNAPRTSAPAHQPVSGGAEVQSLSALHRAGHPGERHLRAPGGLELAAGGWADAEEEV